MENAQKGFIFEIQKFSTEDGPGIRSSVFFKMCPLRCVWCHNPESISNKPELNWFSHKCIGCKTCVEACKQKALKLDKRGLHINKGKCNNCSECSDECPSTALITLGKWWELEDVYREVEKDKIYYIKSKGGITVSGGEPTQQPDFVYEFLKKCKDNDISTALDTCGYASKKIYERLLPVVDLLLLDIKEIDSAKHKEFTGIPNETILENAIWLADYVSKNGKEMWIRTPLIPKYTATEENIRGIGNFIVNKLSNIPERWDILSFNRLCEAKYERLGQDWPLKDEPSMTKEEMENFLDIAKNTGVKNVHWSGLTRKDESADSELKDLDRSKLPSC